MRPLDGITVADFSQVLAGPMSTQILSDLGATVIKITEQDGIKLWTFKWEDHHKETFGRWQVNNRVVLTT